jgi:hypothetical protein
MKTCSKCLLEKDESEFGLHSKASGKLKAACKMCVSAATRKWSIANPDKIKEYNSKFSSKNRERLNEDAKCYRKRNTVKIQEARAVKYAEKSDEIKAVVYEYRRQNPHQVTKWNAARRARVRDLTPELTKEEQERIDYLYWLAKDLRATTGETYHVDHIQPLAKGGLHHPDNLQVLPADINLKKGTK